MYFIHQALFSTFQHFLALFSTFLVENKSAQVSFYFQHFPALFEFVVVVVNKKVLITPFTFLERPYESALAVTSQLEVLWEGGRVIMLPYPPEGSGIVGDGGGG